MVVNGAAFYCAFNVKAISRGNLHTLVSVFLIFPLLRCICLFLSLVSVFNNRRIFSSSVKTKTWVC